MKKPVLLGILLVLFLSAGIIIFLINKNEPLKKTPPASKPSQQAQQSNKNAPPTGGITYTDSGFTPPLLRFRTDSTITLRVTNSTKKPIDVKSDPHPKHSDNFSLNAGIISPGSTKTITISHEGKFGFHNEFTPSHTATIEVIKKK